jgi:hypothetical protein
MNFMILYKKKEEILKLLNSILALTIMKSISKKKP